MNEQKPFTSPQSPQDVPHAECCEVSISPCQPCLLKNHQCANMHTYAYACVHISWPSTCLHMFSSSLPKKSSLTSAQALFFQWEDLPLSMQRFSRQTVLQYQGTQVVGDLLARIFISIQALSCQSSVFLTQQVTSCSEEGQKIILNLHTLSGRYSNWLNRVELSPSCSTKWT